MLENKFKTPCWKVFWVVGKIVEREEFGLKEFVQATTGEIRWINRSVFQLLYGIFEDLGVAFVFNFNVQILAGL